MATADDAYKVGISGSYGGLNMGDEAILHAILAQLRGAVPVEVTVFSRDKEDTLRRHRVERAVGVRDLTREEARAEVARLDLLILGGGGILYDGGAENYLREVQLAHEEGVPVAVYAISAGPLTDQRLRGVVREALDPCAVITVRDRPSKRLLEEVGVRTEVELTADPALLLQAEPLPPDTLKVEGLDPKRRIVAFSVREPGPAAPDLDTDHYHALLADAADFVADRIDADVAFLPMERGNQDLQHSHAVVARMRMADRAHVLKRDYTSGQLLTLVSHMSFAVGMRLHFLIFSLLQGVPLVALPYGPKVRGFAEDDLQLEATPLERMSTGTLLATIDRTWDQRAEQRERLAGVRAELQARARRTNERVVEALAKRHGGVAVSSTDLLVEEEAEQTIAPHCED
jgi:polysaccharide pyruvyl transferase CsaB